MKNRIFPCLFAAALLIGCAVTACGETAAEPETASTAPTVTTEAVTEKPEQPYADACDYGGKSFAMLICGDDAYFYSDEQTGDAMNDAVYERTVQTEDWLNVSIESTPMIVSYSGDFIKAVQELVLAGDTTYHLIIGHSIRGISDFIVSDYLCDWNEIPTIHLEREYWNQSCNRELSVNGHQYVAKSDFILSDPACVMFNKSMIADYDLESPYDLVRSGKWTLDKMFELGAAAAKDLDGDGKMTIADQYGFTSMGEFVLNSCIHASGIRLVSKNADDTFSISIFGDRMVSLVEKFHEYINGTDNAFLWDNHSAPDDKTIKIPTGRVLFQLEPSSRLGQYRGTEVDFGLLPLPKLDEAQDGYASNDWSNLMYIPNTAQDLDMVGNVMETLTYYSQKITVPAYYDVLLGTKLARDADTQEMLGLIFGGIVYDPGVNYFGFGANMMELFYTLPHLVYTQKKGDFASWYEAKSAGSVKEIEAFNEALAK